jgi:hypothetical protein
MNDTKHVLEDMAARFDPPSDGFARCLRLHHERRQRRQRVVAVMLLALVVAAAAVAGIEASRASAAKFPSALHVSKTAATQAQHPQCAANAKLTSFIPSLSSSSGSPGSTITVSGPLPVLDESGTLVGQTASEVIAYWNLDLNHWETALTAPLSPTAAVAGSAVQLLGTQDVASVCNYSFQIRIPSSVPSGTYPIQLLTEASDETGVTTGPMPPVNVQVTGS